MTIPHLIESLDDVDHDEFRLFTFGIGQGDLAQRCVIWAGYGERARARMFQRFGSAWAFDYPAVQAREQIEKWRYVPLTNDEIPPIRKDLPQGLQEWIDGVLSS